MRRIYWARAGGIWFALFLPAAVSGQAPVVPVCEAVLHAATVDLSDLSRFNLGAPPGKEGCGLAELVGAWSPFGVAVSRSGHLQQELRLIVDGLGSGRPDGRLVAWMATPTLDQIVPIGRLTPGKVLTATTDWNKILIVVTDESGPPAPTARRWSGPIVLMGRSRSALLQSLMGHSIFNRAEMQ